MAYTLKLPPPLPKEGWKVKIRDRERLEPPHVTIFHKARIWRVSLRDGAFLEKGDAWSQIDRCVREAIEENWKLLAREWNKLYPRNPVESGGDDDG